jgi:hypothetical protein
MQLKTTTLIVPILLISLGVGWLLTALGVAPSIDWVFTLSLAAVGLAILAINGIDKVSVVLGPFFIVASGLSLLRQTGRMRTDFEVPILVILLGVLLLIARLPAIRVPGWIADDTGSRK